MKEPIRKVELKDGAIRYRLVVDIGLDGNGKRQQLTRTFDKLKEARAELSRIRHETDQGTFVKPSDVTVSQYLVGATRGDASQPKSRTVRRSDQSANVSATANSSPSPSQTSRTWWTGCSRQGASGAARRVPGSVPGQCGLPSAGSRPI